MATGDKGLEVLINIQSISHYFNKVKHINLPLVKLFTGKQPLLQFAVCVVVKRHLVVVPGVCSVFSACFLYVSHSSCDSHSQSHSSHVCKHLSARTDFIHGYYCITNTTQLTFLLMSSCKKKKKNSTATSVFHASIVFFCLQRDSHSFLTF